jgi:hypothetical protein
MRTFLLLVTVLALGISPAAVAAQPEPEPSGDAPNVTCGIDAAAAPAGVTAEVTCINLDPDTWGEHDGAVTVTLQRRTGDDSWTDVAAASCTGRSTNGILVLPCTAAPDVPVEGSVRGLIDLDAPKDWATAIAEPTYIGGRPLPDALAVDACRANEVLDVSDGRPAPPPWVDLCAVTMDAALDEHGEVEVVTISSHVAGFVTERLPTGSWTVSLGTGDGCRHEVRVDDDGFGGIASASLRTMCDIQEGTCGLIGELLVEVFGGACGASGWAELEEVVPLSLEAVAFEPDEVRVELRPDDVGSLGTALMTPGTVVGSVQAHATSGVGTPVEGAERATYDSDTASSTGRTFTIGG